MAMVWGRLVTPFSFSKPLVFSGSFSRSFYSNSKPIQYSFRKDQYITKVGIYEFLVGMGKGMEVYAPLLESRICTMERLMITRSQMLKAIGIPLRHRKLILKYANNFRHGFWKPLRCTMGMRFPLKP